MIRWRDRLSEQEIAETLTLIKELSREGISPVSEHVILHVEAGGDHHDRHLLQYAGDRLNSYAHLDLADPDGAVAEVAADDVATAQRLIMLANTVAPCRIWTHGLDSVATRAAQDLELPRRRTLYRYTRPLADLPDRPLPPGIRLRPFTSADAKAWLALNRQAFQHLPDQAGWSSSDLADRIGQPWFDPAGFLLAEDDDGLVGCHWTKVHGHVDGSHDPIGEVYVLSVADSARGLGLGAALTVAGLQYLRGLGLTTVMLYVDSDNAAAIGMYENLGFELADTDLQFGSPTTARRESGTLAV